MLLQAWVRRRRDHGGVIFLDLRDRSGMVQVVVRPEDAPAAAAALDPARLEWVVEVEGEVARRSAETVNPKMPTGDVEVIAARGGAVASAIRCRSASTARSRRARRRACATATSTCAAPSCSATSGCATKW